MQSSFPGGSDGKESACNAGDLGLIPGLEKSSEEGNGYPLPSHPSRSSLESVIQSAAAAKSLQSCPTLCDPIDSSPPGSPVLGILQARILEWVAISFSGDLLDPGIKPRSSTLAGRFFTI